MELELMMDYPGTPGQRTRIDASYVGHHEMKSAETRAIDCGEIANPNAALH
jgi:hypothetical protein